MPNHTNVIFKKSLLAVAIVSLSACSTTPLIDDYDLSPIGEGIMNAGRTASDVSGRALARTSYLLGFSDDDALGNKNPPMDEVDIALSLEDALLPDATDLKISAVSLPQAIATPQQLTLETPDGTVVASGDSTAIVTDNQLIVPTAQSVVVEDLVHEVASNENLWDISKKTTGDANNWHVLADVNNLAPNASVFPGQQLIIPSDMVKPGYLNAPETTIEQAQSAVESTAVTDTQSVASATSELVENALASVEVAAPASAEVTAPSERLLVPEPGVNELTVQAVASNDASIKLSPGETLWDFAKRTTGDATNWQAIATHNNFTEKQAVIVRAGQSISVPGALVKPDLDLAAVAPKAASVEPVIAAAEADVANTISVADETAVVASSELLVEASTLDETLLTGDAAAMTIVEATYKTDANLAPGTIERTFNDSGNLTLQEVSHGEIMVSGTYYPKAIYNDADFSSSLLMRVSPGTTLQVSKSMGNWFEVETDKGVGYVHQRDIK